MVLLRRGEFELNKWSSNSPALLSDTPEEDRGFPCSKAIASDEWIKILGITWTQCEDAFSFGISLPDDIPRSKRTILSTFAKLYNPFGWVTSVTTAAKILIQRLWRIKIEWDEVIPDDLFAVWQKTYRGLSAFDDLRVSRWTGFRRIPQNLELHGFVDASNAAYVALVYLRMTLPSNQTTVTLLAGKSKVVPPQLVNVPRLELSAAVILARLIEFAQSSLALDAIPCYCWSDSNVALSWLS